MKTRKILLFPFTLGLIIWMLVAPGLVRPEAVWVYNPAGESANNPGLFVDDLIRRVMVSQNLPGPPLAGQFSHERIEIIETDRPLETVNDLFYRRGWTDGLPILPPTPERVREMLQGTDRFPAETVGIIEPMKGIATVEKVAVNAVMAGARPEYLPVILAAVETVADPEFDLYGVQTTDESVTPLLIINGPVARDLKINSGFGALGPGWQSSPNATIGRAVRLVINNIGGAWPGTISLAGIGQPGKYTLCLAENETDSPWSPLHVELGYKKDTSTVTALRAESVYNVFGLGLEEVVSLMGSLGSRMSARRGIGCVGVLLGPYSARELANRGWKKEDVKAYLWKHGRIPLTSWKKQSLIGTAVPAWAKEHAKEGFVPVVSRPQDIILFVAGANLPIPQNVYFPTWAQNPGPGKVTKEIRLPANWSRMVQGR